MDKFAKFSAAHRYVSDSWNVVLDGPKDVWAYDKLEGDCEDYVFAILWYYSDCSKWKFYKNILFGPFKFWYVTVSKDIPQNGHMVLEHKQKDLYTEVLYQTLTYKDWYPRMYFKYPFNKIRVVWNLIRGALIRG